MDSEDDKWVEFPIPTEDVLVPPVRYAVPASTLPPLEVGQEVTWGSSQGWWVIDELQVAAGPFPGEGGEVYELVAMPERGAAQLRPDEQQGVQWPQVRQQTRKVPVCDLWVYRDSETVQWVDALPKWRADAWLDRLAPSSQTPPPQRHPRPARELPSLSGKKVRVPSRAGWAWAMAVSEPVEIGTEIVVHLVSLPDWWDLVYGVGQPRVVTRPVHQVWGY